MSETHSTVKAPEQIGERWAGTYDRTWRARGGRKFLSKETRFFAIGSCFAVNITRWMIAQGLPCAVPNWGLHYNPATVLNEIRIASDRPGQELVWKVNDRHLGEVYVDCLRHTIFGRTPAELAQRRAEIAVDGRNAYLGANAILITLGLGEVWEQATAQGPVILNRAPYPGSEERARCTNRFLTVAETKGCLQEIVATIREVLLDGRNPRQITAIAPVLARNYDKVDLKRPWAPGPNPAGESPVSRACHPGRGPR